MLSVWTGLCVIPGLCNRKMQLDFASSFYSCTLGFHTYVSDLKAYITQHRGIFPQWVMESYGGFTKHESNHL